MMLLEAKALAQIQCAEAIISSGSNCTLHTDGTKRSGKEFGGVQIGTAEGQLSLGLEQIVSGDTSSFLKLIQNLFNDAGSLIDNEQPNKNTAHLFSNINKRS